MTTKLFKSTVKELDNKLNRVLNREKLNKQEIGELSREILAYAYDNNDIGRVNRFINGLTPVNKKVSTHFFIRFLGWSFNEEDNSFKKKVKAKTFAKKLELATEFLADEDNNLWTWEHKAGIVKPLPKNYAKRIANMVTKALTDEKEAITPAELMAAILSSEAVELDDLMSSINA